MDNRNILICVTQQKTCERLIKKAVGFRSEFTGDLFVIHVVRNNLNFLDNNKEGEALEYLFNKSKAVGANLSVLKSDDTAATIAAFAGENKIGCIVLGKSANDKDGNRFLEELKRMLNNTVEIRIVP